MKHLTLIAALFLAACASSTALSNAPKLQRTSLSALPPDVPFRDEILRFAELDRESPPPFCPVLFVGSSSIRMWNSLQADMAPLPVLNRGFGGSRISDVNLYFDRIVTPYRPRAIVFYAGENDLDAGESPDAVAAHFRRFLEMKRARLGSTPLFYISAKPSKLRVAQVDRQEELNAAIRSLPGKDFIFIDVVSPMMNGGQLRDLYVEDGLHMNAAGYAIWTGLVRKALADRKVERLRCRS